MRRALVSTALALAVALGVAVPAFAAVEGGPPCADVENVYGIYQSTGPEEIVVHLKQPPCTDRFTYTLYVYDEADMQTLLSTSTEYVVSGDLLLFSPEIIDPDGDICVAVEVSFVTGGGKRIVLERAPDQGCRTFTLDDPVSPGGGRTWG